MTFGPELERYAASDAEGDVEIGNVKLGSRFRELPGTGNKSCCLEFSPDGVAELEWIYLGSHYLEPDNKHKYGGHQLVNLRVASDFGQRWRATLRVTNLLDEDYAERADFGFGSYRYFVGQPLGAYLEIGYRFSP